MLSRKYWYEAIDFEVDTINEDRLCEEELKLTDNQKEAIYNKFIDNDYVWGIIMEELKNTILEEIE